jgi:hypothetical protein
MEEDVPVEILKGKDKAKIKCSFCSTDNIVESWQFEKVE